MHRMFKLAKEVSTHSTFHPYKIGCVLVKGKRILSVGYNQLRLKRVGLSFANYEHSLHAERDCVSKIKKDLIKGATIFIYREYKDGTPAMVFPCENCMDLLKMVGVRKVMYTISELPYFKEYKL